MRNVYVPKLGDYGLRELLEQIDTKIEVLVIIQQEIELNQRSVQLMAQRFDLQSSLLNKMLGELQTLVHGLHALAAQRDEGSSMQ